MYYQKLDFEADPINKFKPVIKKPFVSISKSIKFPYITQLEYMYCQKLVFEAGSNDKLKDLIYQNKKFRTHPNNKHPRVD